MSIPPIVRHWIALLLTLAAVLLLLFCMHWAITVLYELIDTLRFILSLRTLE
jgi:hypothetical protein